MEAVSHPRARSCGTCTLCCKVMGVGEIGKPVGSWCDHCKIGVGCTIYETRPNECRRFDCGWLMNPAFGPEWKPDRSRIILTVSKDRKGLQVRCDPSFPNAWRKEPYHSQVLGWAREATRSNGTVLVCVGERMTLISPDGEFYLGTVTKDDEILRQFSGKKLIAAHVQRRKGAGA